MITFGKGPYRVTGYPKFNETYRFLTKKDAIHFCKWMAKNHGYSRVDYGLDNMESHPIEAWGKDDNHKLLRLTP